MLKNILTTVTILPLLLGVSFAAQSWSWDYPSWTYSDSEESGTSAYLGVDISDISTERLSALKLKEEKGVEVTMVDQDAPAGKAGLREHDVILTMNGTPIESGAQLRRMIHETPPGRIVALGISRDGQPMTIKVQLADRRKEFPQLAKSGDVHVEIPPIPTMPEMDMPNINVVVVHSSVRSGLTVENITPQLGEFFGVKSGNGVLIRSVEKGSRADKAGFRAGDVVVKVNNQPVHDASDFMQTLRSRSGGAISVGIIRDKKEQNLNLTLPTHKESGEMIEESSSDDASPLNADSYERLSEIQNEIAKLQPEMELASEEAQKAAAEVRKSLCSDSKKMREQAEKMRKELRPEVLQKLRAEQEKLKQEMERMRHEMRGGGFDI
jgi:serine protease Do